MGRAAVTVEELERLLAQYPSHMKVALRVDCQDHDAHDIEGVNQLQITDSHWVVIEG
jgi:hypothetical protein